MPDQATLSSISYDGITLPLRVLTKASPSQASTAPTAAASPAASSLTAKPWRSSSSRPRLHCSASFSAQCHPLTLVPSCRSATIHRSSPSPSFAMPAAGDGRGESPSPLAASSVWGCHCGGEVSDLSEEEEIEEIDGERENFSPRRGTTWRSCPPQRAAAAPVQASFTPHPGKSLPVGVPQNCSRGALRARVAVSRRGAAGRGKGRGWGGARANPNRPPASRQAGPPPGGWRTRRGRARRGRRGWWRGR